MLYQGPLVLPPRCFVAAQFIESGAQGQWRDDNFLK
jgi:hypothetical protein